MPTVSKFESPASEYAALNDLNLHKLLVGEQQHAVFFCYCVGHNLTSRGLFNGDLLIANRALTPCHDDIVLVLHHDEFIIRILDIHNQCLRADNVSPIPLAEDMVVEAVIPQSVRCLHRLPI